MSEAKPLKAAVLPKAVCKLCKHCRQRIEPQLFSGSELQAPGVLKAQIEWDQERKQRVQHEMLRYAQREPFSYEPHNYPWCAAYSNIELVERARKGNQEALQQLMETGGATMNPVSGEINALYVLCAWMNPECQCPRYEPT